MNIDAVSHGRQPRLVVTYYPIDRLKPNPKNPQRHTRKQVEKIARSIRAFDFNCPVLVDGDLNILAGHGRWEASKSLGMTEIATIRLEHLSPHQARAFMIADNQLTKAAAWDNALLAEQLKSLATLELDLGFDLEATGFDLGEIELRVEGLDRRKPDDAATAEELPVVPSTPVTQPGDLWQLGDHRLSCGSPTEMAIYDQLMAGALADMVFTDAHRIGPIERSAFARDGIEHANAVMASVEAPAAGSMAPLEIVMALTAQHSHNGSFHFLGSDWRNAFEVLQAARSADLVHADTCVWVKPNADVGSLYGDQHEFVLVLQHDQQRHADRVRQARLRHKRSNVWHYPEAATLAGSEEENRLLALHPAVMPVDMIADALIDCTARDAVVLDPFAGGGSTLIAAERTGRRARLIEQEPKYADVIIQRWERLTGGSAVHVASGQTYAQRRTS